MRAASSSPPSAVLDRAFALLDVFGPGRFELTLAELAAGSGLPRSTAHRLAAHLERLGALERTPRGWRVGVRMFELGQLVPSQLQLRERALPFMGDLYEATHQTVHLAVLEQQDVVYVEVIAGHQKVRSPSRRGGRVPAHCTAVGKVLLAFAPELPPLEGPELAARTARTITDREQLRWELGEVRLTGLAYDDEEAMPGLCCVAAPVMSHRGAVAALSISMPVDAELTPRQAAPILRTAARGLSRDLQGRGLAPS
ncbi:MAG TPA: IclR family transcriptional regulator [Conexibacter sp.]|nr:IclR family transcriptional regulator [Conexibacter sp.]